MSRVTAMDAREAINRLRFIHPQVKTDEVDGMAEEWAKAMVGLTTDDFERGIDAYIREGGRFFPKPSEIRKLAFEARASDPDSTPTDLHGRYLRWEASNEGPCPVCNATIQDTTWEQRDVEPLIWDKDRGKLRKLEPNDPAPETRFAIIHDLEEHRRKKVPHVGFPYVEREIEPARDSTP